MAVEKEITFEDGYVRYKYEYKYLTLRCVNHKKGFYGNIPELKSFLKHKIYLKKLNVWGYIIPDFSFLELVPHLQYLFLSHSRISDFSSLSPHLNLKYLYLNGHKISDISFLSNFPNLIHLELSGNAISDFSPLKELKHLKYLNLSNNKLSDISFLEFLPTLTHLKLVRNNLVDISPLKCLTNLTFLHLGNNQISDISPLETLKNLTHLLMFRNEIVDISPLQHLTNLKYVELSSNKISKAEFQKSLLNCDRLNIGHNQVSDFSFLKFIPNLKELNIYANKISNVSNFPILSNLILLHLSGNQISDVSSFPILPNLTSLYLSGNQISDVSNFPVLPNLTFLALGYNQISDVSCFSVWENLKALDLNTNQITNFSLQTFNNFPNLLYLNLEGNSIRNIPREIYKEDYHYGLGRYYWQNYEQANIKKIRHFLEDLENHQAEENREIKVIFVGNGSVGKTQVAKRLVEQNAFVFDGQHNSTHAIVMLRRKLADFQLNCWDFAGQDLYHDTHKIFMQTKALFVLVWDAENEKNDFHTWNNKQYENEKLEYWLKYAKYFGNNSPILVLQNKIDIFLEDLYVEQKEKLKETYPIVDFLEVSAKTNEGFEAFEQQLAHIFATHSNFKTPDLPKNWVKIREEIIKLQETETKTVSFSEFEEICKNHGTPQSAHTILQYLHDTGVLYYHSRYFEKKIIINQSWVIEAIYKVLDRESAEFEVIQQQKGILFYQNMCNIWRNNTETERWLFVNFMLSAGLAIEITNHKNNEIYKEENRIFAIPQLLPKEKPAQIITWEQENTNNLHEKVLFYHFLPKQTIYSFMRYAIALTNQNTIWRQGIWLKMDNDFIFVEVFYEDEKSKIVIKSNKTTLIEKILKELKIADYA